MKGLFIIGILTMLIVPIVYADIVSPGEDYIQINSKITNLASFPDYVFISYGSNIGPSMCPPKVLAASGEVETYYKLCGLSVYAIKESDFKSVNITAMNKTQIQTYLEINSKMVLTNMTTSAFVKESNPPAKDVNYSYEIDITKTLQARDPHQRIDLIKTDYQTLWYILIPALAIIIILFVIFIRKKK